MTDIGAMINRIRAKRTPEEVLAQLAAHKLRREEREAAERKRSTCSECGVDLRHGSHSFRCYYRGWL